jgi:hypothetical protein
LLILPRFLRSVKRFCKVNEQLLKTLHDTLMPFYLSLPTTSRGILDEPQFDFSSMAQPRSILGGGDELGTGEIQITILIILAAAAYSSLPTMGLSTLEMVYRLVSTIVHDLTTLKVEC